MKIIIDLQWKPEDINTKLGVIRKIKNFENWKNLGIFSD
jgi:hypothetical protein